ncbi:sugar ABC transporter substrate-binding protein [Gordonia sp. NPDC127522]|uniref:sugar ABC transporter substrate-binding protein n=1 Tax=Gordonia sp. NPDC127522 TaxID=3345390 RepID=UPI0036380D78
MRSFKGRGVAVAISACVALAVGACSSGGDASSGGTDGVVEPITIGWLDSTLAGEFQQRLYQTATAAAEELGWEIKTVDTAGDPSKAAAGAVTLANQGVDAIIMSSVNPSNARAGLTRAAAKDVPIVMIGSEVDGSLNEELGIVYYGKKEADLTAPLAQAIVDDLAPGDQVGILNSTQLISGTIRSDGIEGPLKDANIEVVGTVDTGFAFNDALGNANSLIAQNPNLKAIVPVYDIWTAPVVAAVKASGRDIKVYPFEADPVNVKLMRENPSMIPALTDGNLIDSPLIAFDQLLKHFVEGQDLDPNAADGAFDMSAIRFEQLPPGSQNGPVAMQDALQPYLDRWNASYQLP